MVAPEELPSFHIEVKGTASPKLEKSKLKKWVEQLNTDCPYPDRIRVIFNKANNKSWLCLLPHIDFACLTRDAVEGMDVIASLSQTSFQAHEMLEQHKMYNYLTLLVKARLVAEIETVACFNLGEGQALVAMDADLTISYMLAYESRIKAK